MRVRALALGLLLAGNAAAAPQPYRIEYTAPAGCSSREAFVHELTARTPVVRLALETEQAATYGVAVGAHGSGMIGELVLREPDGRETRRALRGKTCDEVVRALAFIAAILVDPEAVSRVPGEPPSLMVTARMVPPSPARTEEREPVSHDGKRFRLGASAGASLETTVSPTTAFGPYGELFLERNANGARGLSFGAAFHHVSAPSVRTRAGRADFSWTAGRAWFCPLSLPSRGIFSFAPCGEIEAGALKVEGSDTIDKKTVIRPWVAFGPLARLELRPTPFLALTLDTIAVFTPISHPTFYFSPDIEVFSVPMVGLASRAGIRAILP
jgi:hypothetical protein